MTTKYAGWENLPDEAILHMRVRDLGLTIPGSPLEPWIQRLYAELDSRGLRFHPPCYLADEWLCPDKTPIIGIPFCLVHPRLKRLEEKMMYEVEGGSPETGIKLLRHECGHAVNYAYQLYRKSRWRELFGPFTRRYSDSYYYEPYSRRYVIHLKDNYAQAHPDEDFAETFAVWLDPESRWEERYRDWPVLRKLRYVDRAMKKIAGKPPRVVSQLRRPPWSASRMISTLAGHYSRKQRALGVEFIGFYDECLLKLFDPTPVSPASVKASRLLRRYRKEITDSVASWTRHRKYDIHQLMGKLIHRCQVLGLHARSSEADVLIKVTSLVTSIAGKTFKNRPKRKRA